MIERVGVEPTFSGLQPDAKPPQLPFINGVSDGIQTHVSAVTGRGPRSLDDRHIGKVGIEPTPPGL